MAFLALDSTLSEQRARMLFGAGRVLVLRSAMISSAEVGSGGEETQGEASVGYRALSPEDMQRLAGMTSTSRRQEFLEGRKLLSQAEIEIQNGIYSLSHTAGWVFSIGVESGSPRDSAGAEFVTSESIARESVGLDVEREDRAVSSAVAHRIVSEEERQAGWKPLEAWVIKEAAYKALSAAGEAPGPVPTFRIEVGPSAVESGWVRSSSGVRAQFVQWRDSGWLVALARYHDGSHLR